MCDGCQNIVAKVVIGSNGDTTEGELYGMAFFHVEPHLPVEMVLQNKQSSANRHMLDVIPVRMSFVYDKNSRGPRTVPCVTLDETGVHSDDLTSMTTH